MAFVLKSLYTQFHTIYQVKNKQRYKVLELEGCLEIIGTLL